MTDRAKPKSQNAADRILHNDEFVSPLSQEQAAAEGGRCMDCGTPFCRSSCPLGNDIPGFNRAIGRGDVALAYNILRRTNPFPEFTGRVCPAPCEAGCTKGLVGQPIAIEHLEQAIADAAWDKGLVAPEPPIQSRRNHRVAVIGSGPAGLTAAYWLNKWGHQVTVFERSEIAGGLLTNGIPNFKLAKELVTRRIDFLKQEGVQIVTGCNVGYDIEAVALLNEFDRIVLACGAAKARGLNLNHSQLIQADAFLWNQIRHGEKVRGQLTGKTVIILGGGDTGSDCVGTANRQGAAKVIQVEISHKPQTLQLYPRLQTEISTVYWPELPHHLRTSSSHEEGCERVWDLSLRELVVDPENRLKGARFSCGSGNDEVLVPCDLMVVAIGYLGAEGNPMLAEFGLKLDGENRLPVSSGRTSHSRVYAAGDMQRGASLVVHAIADGLTVARAIHRDAQRDHAAAAQKSQSKVCGRS